MHSQVLYDVIYCCCCCWCYYCDKSQHKQQQQKWLISGNLHSFRSWNHISIHMILLKRRHSQRIPAHWLLYFYEITSESFYQATIIKSTQIIIYWTSLLQVIRSVIFYVISDYVIVSNFLIILRKTKKKTKKPKNQQNAYKKSEKTAYHIINWASMKYTWNSESCSTLFIIICLIKYNNID